MEINYTSLIYDDGSYVLGEITNNCLDGIGYMYWAKNDKFLMGEFSGGRAHGWVCDTLDDGEIRFAKWSHGSLTNSFGIVSWKEIISFYEYINNSNRGLSFNIQENGNWDYRYRDGTNSYKCVYYSAKAQKLYVGYVKDGKWEWSKEIGGDDIDCNLSLPYSMLHTEIETDPGDFVEDHNIAYSETGPTVLADDEDDPTIVISSYGGEDADGINYINGSNMAVIRQMDAGIKNGPDITFSKDGKWFTYSYWEDDEISPRMANWNNDGTLEVRLYSDKNHCSFVSINEHLDVCFIKNYNLKTEKYDESFQYSYDEAEGGSNETEEDEEEPVSKPSKKKTKKSDLSDDISSLISKYLKKSKK